MKLYVCWGKFPLPGGHPCETAYTALKKAGHDPKVIRSHGGRQLPDLLNRLTRRRQVEKLTGQFTVPVLVTDDGEVITESTEIARWAEAHPATASTATKRVALQT
jgi:hypothetical protein